MNEYKITYNVVINPHISFDKLIAVVVAKNSVSAMNLMQSSIKEDYVVTDIQFLNTLPSCDIQELVYCH